MAMTPEQKAQIKEVQDELKHDFKVLLKTPKTEGAIDLWIESIRLNAHQLYRLKHRK
jgi:hypothetical protein